MVMRLLHNYVTSMLKPPTCQLPVYHTRLPSFILFFSSDSKHHRNITRIESSWSCFERSRTMAFDTWKAD
jgi:hypothetical protein